MLNTKKLKAVFGQSRRDAKRRGIAFEFSFEQWIDVWLRSGHLEERGRRKGQYVMARHHDRGPYAIHNVSIILCEQNHKDAATQMLGIAKTADHRAKLAAAHIGLKASLETRNKLSVMRKGKPLGPFSEEHRRNLSKAAHRRRGPC